ncbi:MAG: OmpA family protein [Deltaproteobacteria bacterium]|nr:OmpA family protein [Deltaproteobacteria bacterium]
MKAVFLASAIVAFAATASAQTLPPPGTLQASSLLNFSPTFGAHGWFSREYAIVGKHIEPNAALWISYARAPLVRFVNNQLADETVAHQLQFDAVGALSIFEILEIGVGVPFVPFQSGAGLPLTTLAIARALNAGAFGDLRLQGKVSFFNSEYVHLGAAALITFPTGDESNFAGEQTVTGVPRLLATFTLADSRLVLSLDAGVRLRGAAVFGEITLGHELLFGTSIAYEILKNRLFAGVEFYGAAGFRFQSLVETPIEGSAGVKLRLGPIVISLGAGTGLTSGYGAPRYRVLAGVSYAPSEDTSRPAEPEPRPVDVILMPATSQPVVVAAEPPLREIKVEITRQKIAISDKVYFKLDSDEIDPVSFPLLDKVAEVMVKTPRLRLVRVEGHTDNVGSDKYNKKLSDRRSRSVMRYLVKQGVAANRLIHHGYGEKKPKMSNMTSKGRAVNRRVEFVIVKQTFEANEVIPVAPSFDENAVGTDERR